MGICFIFAIFYCGIFYGHGMTTLEIKPMITATTLWTTQPTSTLSETTETTEELMTTALQIITEELSTTDETTNPTETMISTTEKLTSTTETPQTSSKKITTSTTKVLLSTKQLISTTDKTTTENVSTIIPFVTQMTQSDNNEEAITALSIIAGVSVIANVILSILLFRSCKRIPSDNDTMPIYTNENVSNTDQPEMYTGLDFKEDCSAYQPMARGNEVIYNNTNL